MVTLVCGCGFQDNQCGIVTNIDIECAVKLVGTNCVLYPVNSKDLHHIWVRKNRDGHSIHLTTLSTEELQDGNISTCDLSK